MKGKRITVSSRTYVRMAMRLGPFRVWHWKNVPPYYALTEGATNVVCGCCNVPLGLQDDIRSCWACGLYGCATHFPSSTRSICFDCEDLG